MKGRHVIDWGNVPAWFGAVFTPGSVLIAYRTLRRGDKRAERAQASNVYLIDATTGRAAAKFQVKVVIQNRSSGPVYAVNCCLVLEEVVSGKVKAYAGISSSVTIQPGDSSALGFDLPIAIADRALPTIGVKFRDANGVLWTRLHNGQLVNMRTGSFFWLLWPARARLRAAVRKRMTVQTFAHYELA